MQLDHYITLGRSGLRVSPMCLGGMTFGLERGWGSSPEDAKKIIDRYLEMGGNFLDTANSYNFGHSEKIIGDHVASDSYRREGLVIASKFCTNLRDGDPNGGGANRKSIFAACDQSLRRLQTDYIDLYWMHWWDKFTPIEETMDAMNDLVRSGKVRYIGFSNTPAWKVAHAQTRANFLNQAPVAAMQIEYSLLERTPEAELLPLAKEFGVGITPYSPLKSGILSGKYTRETIDETTPNRGERLKLGLTEKVFTVLDLMREIADQHSTTVARVALAWTRSKQEVSSIIVGARTMDQLEDNLASLAVQLNNDDLAALDKLTTPNLGYPMRMIDHGRNTGYAGLTINGETFADYPFGKPTRENVF